LEITVSEHVAKLIRDQVQEGRYPSEGAVVEDAVRRMAGEASDDGLALQRRLVAAGLLGEVKPPIVNSSPWAGRQAVPIHGEPLSETIVQERPIGS